MNTLILQFKKITGPCLAVFALGCFALRAQAIEPAAPATALPNFNTADGDSALAGLTTGFYNSAFGFLSLFSNGSASFNTGVGAGTLFLNTASEQTAVGTGTLFSNTTGANNTGCGTFALFSNGTANNNTAVGTNALLNNDKTVAGLGNVNTAVGSGALQNNVDGDSNTAVGAFALFSENATGGFPNGVSNNAIGRQALTSNTTGSFNEAMGVNALVQNTIGNGNIAIGDDAMFHNLDASGNTAVGGGALSNNVSGAQNTVVGSGTGENLVNAGSDGNIYIGAGAGGATDEVAFIRIGVPTFEGFPYDTYIAGIFDRDVDAATAVAVFADTNQKVGTNLVDAKGNKVPFKPQAMLDESLRQQKRIAELEATVERQQKGMEVLTAQLKEQAAQIQKVSAHIEASKPATQVAESNY
jgi:hypothetical protein